GHITGHMIKNTDVHRGVMCESEKPNARADTGAQNADAIESLAFQPFHRRARVQHGLAHRLDRTADVRADEMVGTFEFRWSSLFVIWQCQPQRSHPQAVKDATGFYVTIRLGVPLWQDDNGGAWFILPLTSRRKQPCARQIVVR